MCIATTLCSGTNFLPKDVVDSAATLCRAIVSGSSAI